MKWAFNLLQSCRECQILKEDILGQDKDYASPFRELQESRKLEKEFNQLFGFSSLIS